MQISEIKVENARAPSEKMKAANIYGSFDLAVITKELGDSCPFLVLKKLSLRKSKDGRMFIAPPQETVKKDDGTTNYFPYYRITPNKDTPNRDDMDKALIEKVKQAITAASKKPAPVKVAAKDDSDEIF